MRTLLPIPWGGNIGKIMKFYQHKKEVKTFNIGKILYYLGSFASFVVKNRKFIVCFDKKLLALSLILLYTIYDSNLVWFAFSVQGPERRAHIKGIQFVPLNRNGQKF